MAALLRSGYMTKLTNPQNPDKRATFWGQFLNRRDTGEPAQVREPHSTQPFVIQSTAASTTVSRPAAASSGVNHTGSSTTNSSWVRKFFGSSMR